MSHADHYGDPDPTKDNSIEGEPEVAALCSKATRIWTLWN